MKKMIKVGWSVSKIYFLMKFLSLFLYLVQFILLMVVSRYIGMAIISQNIEVFTIAMMYLSFHFLIDLLMENINKYVEEKQMEIDCSFENQLFHCLMSLPYYYLEDKQIQDDIYKVHWGIMVYGSFGKLIQSLTTLLRNFLIFLSTIIILQFTHKSFIVIILCVIIVYVFFQKKVLDIQYEYENKTLRLERKYSRFGELFLGYEHAKDIRIYNAQELFEEKFNQESIYPFYKERFKKQFPYLSLSNIVESAGFLIIYGYIFYGISQKIIPLSSFVMYVTMMTNFLSSLQEFGVEIFNVRNSMIYVKTYFKFIDQYHKPQNGKDIKTWNTIRFENVSYQYPESCQYAIKDLSLEIHNGEKISIVGENGSGKTTFIKLLLRLLPVTSGNIYIDNISIYDMSFEDYIKRFSATFQDYKLLAFTIAENLSMANAYEDEQLKQVLEAFHLDFLKTQLSKDYSKRFHDDGIILSGGEEQRLAIARSLLKDSDILILDEPTASLDAYTEKQLYGLVREITQDKTLILITHRLINSTLTDRILMFQDGRIVEDGSQHDLLLKNGKYKNLYDKQILFQ